MKRGHGSDDEDIPRRPTRPRMIRRSGLVSGDGRYSDHRHSRPQTDPPHRAGESKRAKHPSHPWTARLHHEATGRANVRRTATRTAHLARPVGPGTPRRSGPSTLERRRKARWAAEPTPVHHQSEQSGRPTALPTRACSTMGRHRSQEAGPTSTVERTADAVFCQPHTLVSSGLASKAEPGPRAEGRDVRAVESDHQTALVAGVDSVAG